MAIFKCKMCGGTLEIDQTQTTGECQYCGTTQTLPKLDTDRRENLYDRASHFRRNNEYDKATAIYEEILKENGTDAEAYWSLVLCRYGIEYVEDPITRKRVPTVNRAQFTSVFDDDNYKSALGYADPYQRGLYEAEAQAINEIQKGILAISQKEEPFDVFVCYKETDHNGRRTPDSVLANDLYHQLTQEGFKVFFARITLEDKLGAAYEPYIFAALNSAKVMVVLGTRPEYFSAVWVKNEWSRYLSLVKTSGGKKVLIPAYKDMDPYDLPEEFSHLQAQDMGKLGFMQDLIRGIKKLTETEAPKATVQEAPVMATGATAPLLKRAFIYLEDGEWKNADEYCERVLDMDPENGEAYLGKLLAEGQVNRKQDLEKTTWDFTSSANYRKIQQFGSPALNSELEACAETIRQNILKSTYDRACVHMGKNTVADLNKAVELFETISQYGDSAQKAEECRAQREILRKDLLYREAMALKNKSSVNSLNMAITKFRNLGNWKNAPLEVESCKKRLEELKAEQIEYVVMEDMAEKQRSSRRKLVLTVIFIGVVLLILGAVAAANENKIDDSFVGESFVGEVTYSGVDGASYRETLEIDVEFVAKDHCIVKTVRDRDYSSAYAYMDDQYQTDTHSVDCTTSKRNGYTYISWNANSDGLPAMEFAYNSDKGTMITSYKGETLKLYED